MMPWYDDAQERFHRHEPRDDDPVRRRTVKPYYERDGITIYHGDCLDILPTLGPVDLVLTDPPYGINKTTEYDDSEFLMGWMNEVERITPAMGIMPGIWNIARLPQRVGRLEYRWLLAAHLVNGMTHGAIGWGNWIPCAVYSARGTSLFVQESDIKRFVIGTDDKPDHPSPKPLSVMRWLVGRLPGEVILDPFAGSGTTGRAALDLGRKAILIEREERWCEVAAKRMAQAVLL